MRKAPLLALLLLGACTLGRDTLPDGVVDPGDSGVLVGSFDFSRVNWETRVGIRSPGSPGIWLAPAPGVFAIAVPPGRYKLESIDAWRPQGEELWFDVHAGEAVYIGSWTAVLGLDVELRDELAALRPELERRWGLREVRNGMPGRPRRIVCEVDPVLSDRPEWGWWDGR